MYLKKKKHKIVHAMNRDRIKKQIDRSKNPHDIFESHKKLLL